MHAEPPSDHCAHKGSCWWPCQWSVFLQSIIKYDVTIIVTQMMRQDSSLLTKDYVRPECNNFTLFNESYVNIRLHSLQFASPRCVQVKSMLSKIQLTEFQTQNWWRERLVLECNIFTLFKESYVNIGLHSLQLLDHVCAGDTWLPSNVQLTEFQANSKLMKERETKKRKVFHLSSCDQSDFQNSL